MKKLRQIIEAVTNYHAVLVKNMSDKDYSRDKIEAIRRDSWMIPGYKSHRDYKEARSFVHSTPTHHVLEIKGHGVKFKQRMKQQGFKVKNDK